VKHATLTLVATTCLAGCLGGSSVPPRTYYVLQDQAPASDAAAAPSGRQSLVVAASAADVFYDAESLVFSRSPDQRAYYQFAAWTDRPARSIVQLAERRLQARGRFASVTGMAAGVRADLVLNIGIVQFYHDVAAHPPVVRVELATELIDWRTRSLLAQRIFATSAPVASADSHAAAEAFNRAVTAALDALVPWVETQAVQAGPEPG
jgi:cholesterol transport system auxiliary component